MTVLVVVRKGNKACIAGDTQSNQGNLIVSGENRTSPKKIHYCNGSYIGICGSMAHHRVFRSLMRQYPQHLNFEGADNIFESFRRIQTILKEDYFLRPNEDDQDQEYESNHWQGVICNATGIYHFQSYREVSELSCYWSAGSGTELALGALYAGYELLEDVEQIARLAVTAACHLTKSCGLPLESYVVELTNQ
jgi:ATP-dependent protease HslVU (ClpYQ) peptidase subunit